MYKLQIYQIAESNRMENFFVRIGMLCRAPDYTTYFTLIDAGVGGNAVHSDRKKILLNFGTSNDSEIFIPGRIFIIRLTVKIWKEFQCHWTGKVRETRND